MKALTCEMCGSTNLIKDGGVFVCQSCGTKYSVEEAKKMMIEGVVSVKGSVVVDNTSSIDNYLIMAKNASKAGNHLEAESYCNKIIEIDSQHCEAWLLKGTSAGWQSTLANIRLEETINCYNNALSFTSESNIETIKKSIHEELSLLSSAITKLACDHFSEFPTFETATSIHLHLLDLVLTIAPIVESNGGDSELLKKNIGLTTGETALNAYNHAKSLYNNEEHPSEYEWKDYLDTGDGCIYLLDFATGLCHITTEDAIRYYNNMIKIQEELARSQSWTYSVDAGRYVVEYTLTNEAINSRFDRIMEYHNSIKELNPEYVIPERPKVGGCYIATAVYGSYDCPEVWTLRRFRDYTLAETWYGRLFIKAYYAISPTLVKHFGNSIWFKKLFASPINKLVKHLKNKGVECTPYKDKIFK